MHLHPLAAIVKNESGVLSGIAGLFTNRGFNIESLAVGGTENPDYSRMTIVVRGDDNLVEQIVKQLSRLIGVVKVSDLAEEDHVERELALVKVHTTRENRSEIIELIDIFRAKIIDVSRNALIVEVTGDTDKVQAMIDLLTPFGIKEIVRTGRVVIARGSRRVEVK
ncbi:MAG: acetolactate synthase small subunit [Candidatus Bipolaricaulia bacterium]